MKVADYEQRPDFPRMGSSLLIASALILAVRTAKWLPTLEESLVSPKLDQEIEFSVLLASRVLSRLLKERASMFPSRHEARYVPEEGDDPG